MAAAQCHKLNSKPATVDDVIGWLTEQTLHTGNFRLSTVSLPEQIRALASAGNRHPTTSALPISCEIDVATALSHATADWNRGRYLAKKLQDNQRIFPEATQMVHKWLIAAGLPEQELERMIKQKLGLRLKIVKLQELSNHSTVTASTMA